MDIGKFNHPCHENEMKKSYMGKVLIVELARLHIPLSSKN